MKKNIDSMLSVFIENAVIHTECGLTGDYKKVNNAYKKIQKIYLFLLKDTKLAQTFIDKAMENNNEIVHYWAAVFCLALSYRVEEAINIFESYSLRSDVGILSFDSKYVLKQYRENGYLKL